MLFGNAVHDSILVLMGNVIVRSVRPTYLIHVFGPHAMQNGVEIALNVNHISISILRYHEY